MRLVAYNFLAGGSARRCGHWELVERDLRPDLLFAQECPPPPADLAIAAGRWRRAPGRRWGTGIFVWRGALEPIPVPGYAGWVVGGAWRGAGAGRRPLLAYSLHCPHGGVGYVRTLDLILDRLAVLARGADLMLGGDFNVAAGLRPPGDPVRTGVGERRLLARLIEELELVPCWQELHAGEPLVQTLRWSGNRATPYHCDGIFVPRGWRARLTEAEVVRGARWSSLSDHNPVLAVLG